MQWNVDALSLFRCSEFYMFTAVKCLYFTIVGSILFVPVIQIPCVCYNTGIQYPMSVLYVCLSFSPPCLSIYLFIHISVYLSPPLSFPIYLSLPLYLSLSPEVYLPLYPSIYLLSIYFPSLSLPCLSISVS